MTEIVNIIDSMLVAFVSISLVVSSIMIGVIAYISVLERRKEIGILRAIGDATRNVSEVFNAETLIDRSVLRHLWASSSASCSQVRQYAPSGRYPAAVK